MIIIKLDNKKDLLVASPFKKNKKGLASVILATNSPKIELVIYILITCYLKVNIFCQLFDNLLFVGNFLCFSFSSSFKLLLGVGKSSGMVPPASFIAFLTICPIL